MTFKKRVVAAMRRILILMIATLAACSTAPRGTREPANDPSAGSSVEILYTLGHSKYRIWMVEESADVKAESTLDGNLISQARLERVKYSEFKRKILEFVQASRASERTPAQADGGCRNPFRVILSPGLKDSAGSTVTGCRGRDDRGVGRLIRDAEFLIYSQK